MSPAWLLVLLAIPGQGNAPGPAAEPRRVEIGEPVLVELEVLHPRSERLAWDAARVLPDDSWILLEGPNVLRQDLPGEPDRVLSRARLLVASLEPGPRSFTPRSFTLGGEAFEPGPTALEVRPALAPGEDQPRPPRGFRPARDFAGERSLLAPLALGGAAVLVGLGWLAARRWRRRKATPLPAPSARERLAALAGRREPEALRAAFFEWSTLLRAAADRRLGRERAGLTDEEWLAATPAGLLPPGAAAELARLLGRAERVKYGLETPTVFALEEALGAGAALLEVLEAPEAPVGPGSREVAA